MRVPHWNLGEAHKSPGDLFFFDAHQFLFWCLWDFFFLDTFFFLILHPTWTGRTLWDVRAAKAAETSPRWPLGGLSKTNVENGEKGWKRMNNAKWWKMMENDGKKNVENCEKWWTHLDLPRWEDKGGPDAPILCLSRKREGVYFRGSGPDWKGACVICNLLSDTGCHTSTRTMTTRYAERTKKEQAKDNCVLDVSRISIDIHPRFARQATSKLLSIPV